MKTANKNSIQIVEVGLRDGLQNEKALVSIQDRVHLAGLFREAGISRMELGAFVRPDWVPQMAGSKEVIEKVFSSIPGEASKKKPLGKISSKAMADRSQVSKALKQVSPIYSALVPNRHGFEEALETGIKEVAIFGAATESFSQKNINCSIDESFVRFAEVLKLAKKNKVRVRGYLSTCFGCPFEGEVDEKKVVVLAQRMIALGCFEVSISDTIGVADPAQVESLFKKLKRVIPLSKLAAHFHDTRGTALANILMAHRMGIRTFDSSLGGLGGCPYAPGAAGNVATEDVVYLFERMGISTGVDLSRLIKANHWMAQVMGKELLSKVSKAGLPAPLGKVEPAKAKK